MANNYGVIFDVDGVLIDSYQAHFKSWQIFAREQGTELTEERFATGFGRTSRELMLELWPERNLTDSQLAALDCRKEALFREEVTRNYPEMPGAKELWNDLHHAGFQVGVGSSGPPGNVHLALQHLDPNGLASAIVTSADVTKGKPHPEVFLRGAEQMGIAPNRCVVVEDAVHGVEAAHAAGMKAIGFVSTGRTKASLAIADLLVHYHSELSPEVFRNLVDLAD